MSIIPVPRACAADHRIPGSRGRQITNEVFGVGAPGPRIAAWKHGLEASRRRKDDFSGSGSPRLADVGDAESGVGGPGGRGALGNGRGLRSGPRDFCIKVPRHVS